MIPRELIKTRIPKHIAIIMDGNGRWAKKRRLPRIFGHRAGVKRVKDIVRACGEWGVEVLTLYAFSVENWARPKTEIGSLWSLLRKYLKREIDEILGNNVRLMTIGDPNKLPKSARDELLAAIDRTSSNTGLVLNLSLNYSGRSEIVHAFIAIIKANENKHQFLEKLLE